MPINHNCSDKKGLGFVAVKAYNILGNNTTSSLREWLFLCIVSSSIPQVQECDVIREAEESKFIQLAEEKD